jgi:hypothetical protein
LTVCGSSGTGTGTTSTTGRGSRGGTTSTTGSGNGTGRSDLSVSSSGSKSLSSIDGISGSSGGLALLGGSLSLDTAGNTGLVADIRADGLRSGAGGGHVGINVRKDVDATVLVDQVNVADGSHTLNRHLL